MFLLSIDFAGIIKLIKFILLAQIQESFFYLFTIFENLNNFFHLSLDLIIVSFYITVAHDIIKLLNDSKPLIIFAPTDRK